ncbi:glycosyl hydrolase family 32 (plasmid) [Deinococcus metallilatus]|uniref:Glycoside hydrolase family 32 protein n=1 Tax=Deinococcus metallilatus TaxID=1211322 RepID=A0AAJ5F679_9DEIO|nr:family 43 glycosylhydrolase [Deinococcus metallilatus]MBB5293456.1 hypothetical protein [Deinococcus metallilatus]QBY06542.1 glycosyl hydrolase family 32 [Deinococcus metallilatus]RXJ17885.1 glycosyl hydrolase family 32 [Deinococcus metallilatus]TLK32157.1 glycoside hydrolase family 32 protein [Deinococcus metallilatus]GMA15324.1 hypothetical protein GCM10025871_16550 [Deinococcus metallilatus]
MSALNPAGVAAPRIASPFVHLYDPNLARPGDDRNWYTNDHTVFRGQDGLWHATGICGVRPADPFAGEQVFFHARGASLEQGGWEECPPTLRADHWRGERFLWAPHVVRQGGRYVMAYAAGGPRVTPEHPEGVCDHYGLYFAHSEDGEHWARHPLNPIFREPGHARDPMLLQVEDGWRMYYTGVMGEEDRRGAVRMRRSPDLEHWSGAQVVNVQPGPHDFGRDAESPFVVEREGVYYLFVCRAMSSYRDTRVYASHDPARFEQEVARLAVHAAEVVQDGDSYYITDTGWDKCGLYAARLEWS